MNLNPNNVQERTAGNGRCDGNSMERRILIVDDEPMIRNILKTVVEAEGFKADLAQNGQEALNRLKESCYQIILTDMRMPVMDGLCLLQQVRAGYEDTPVIMITAVGDAASAIEALSAGACDYVIKPFNVSELRNKVLSALDRRRLILENKQYQSFLEQRVQEQTASLQDALESLERTYSHTLEALIFALDAREHETQRHSKRVSDYTLIIAREIGVPQEDLTDIERGALLHDIGKIGISDNILLKPGKLTEPEWTEVRKHPEIGYHLLKGIDFLAKSVQLVLQHHERFDGAGYPQRLKGEDILLGARIFAIVDTFDAMTSDRPYRKALGYQAARDEIIRCSGSQFDPRISQAFLKIPEERWVQTRASLETTGTWGSARLVLGTK
jgi:putative nucleotidyltransferase with HDIG domain